MIPAPFEYRRARSVDEAIDLLGEHEDAKLLAGGHSLIPLLRLRFARIPLLVDISRLDELRYVRDEGDWLAIGALTRHADLARDPVVTRNYSALGVAAGHVGDPQVRHRGTIGGSLAHADPAADLAPVLLAAGTELVARGPEGPRTIPITAFHLGVFETALGPRELLTQIRVPRIEASAYLRHSRRAHDWATVAAAVVVSAGATRVALGSMGSTPLRACGVEQALGTGASLADAAERAPEGTSPSDDVAGSAAYRCHLAKVLVRRALEQARPQADACPSSD